MFLLSRQQLGYKLGRRIAHHQAVAIIAVVSTLTVGTVGPTAPTALAASANKPRTIKAYSADSDPNGQNIRASATGKAKIIGQLPPMVTEEGVDYGPYFDILQVTGDWAQVTNAQSWNGGSISTTRGWISTKFVRFYLQTEVGFAGPSNSTKPTWDRNGNLLGDSFSRLTGCSGEYAQVTPTGKGAPKKAWARGVCEVQETSCDGLPGDDLKDCR